MLTRAAPFLKTPIKEFFHFLEGKEIPPYEDTGEKLVNNLSSVLYKCLHERFNEFLSEQRQILQDGKESQSIRDIDVVDFFIKVFPTYDDLYEGPFHDALSGLKWSSMHIIFGWLTYYQEAELDTLKNPSAQSPLFGIFSRSPAYTFISSFLEDACAFHGNIDEDDVALRCFEIKDAVMDDLMDYLKRLSIGEANTQPRIQGGEKHSPPRCSIVAGGLNQQDATTQDIESREWLLAWKEEFRGSALENLEVKLNLNVQALQTVRRDKLQMSRIIPIVQSSGTGKSRLAEQYVTENFGVMLGLKNGQGYPPHDDYVFKYFKNLLKLEGRGWDTPDDPDDLSDLNKDDMEEYLQRSRDGGYLVDETRSVYTAAWRYQRPSGRSVPKGWAAVGRLRVACFLIGFFSTMISYMNTEAYATVQNWFGERNLNSLGLGGQWNYLAIEK